MTHSIGMKTAGVLGFLGVALGAFGAHGLKGWLATLPDGAERLEWWHLAVQYHLVHAVFVLGCAALGASKWTTRLAVAGIALFSGSLYLMTLSGIRILGAITPLGGLCFLAAWAMLVFTRRADPASPGST